VPNCVGAIDATHIRVQSSELQYVCRKEYKTINIQVVCDADRKIRDIYDERGAMPGSMNDQTLFSWSSAKKWIARLPLMGQLNMQGVGFGFFVAADGGYANRPGCITPYAKSAQEDQLPAHHRAFNFWHSSLRMIIEQCFGNLRGRWQILDSFDRLPYSPDEAQRIFTCCAILQNFCIDFEGPQMRRDIVNECHSATLGEMNPEAAYNDSIGEKERGEQLRSALSIHLHEVHYSEVYDINNDIEFDDDLLGNIV
jgi:hypothetical protein